MIVYNPSGSIGNKWEIVRESGGPGAEIDFAMTDAGQMSYTTQSLTGTSHTGLITFSAQTLQNS